jgi:colanic acid/amylovoran biosynthesis glycosyltransferase
MARGLPVISTRHSGIPELVQERVTGFLVDEHDVDALAESILLLADSPQLWEVMGEAARERVTRLHDIERQSAIIEQLYDELMTGMDTAAVHAIGQFQQIPETKVA